jgi:hypothetical protein
MPQGRRSGSTLAKLEAELHALNARRHAVIQEITSLVEQLSLTVMPKIAALGQAAGLGAELPTSTAVGKPRRKMSAAARAKLAASAKRRWAEAKKAGKKSLG